MMDIKKEYEWYLTHFGDMKPYITQEESRIYHLLTRLFKEWKEQQKRIAELEEIIQYERLEAAEQAVIELGIQLEEMKKREDEFMAAEKRIRESLLNQLKEKDAEIERLKELAQQQMHKLIELEGQIDELEENK